MNSETEKNSNNREKQKQTSVKIEWIFGIRKDLQPNIYMLDADTLVYPASHYIVIYNLKKISHGPIQQFIHGSPHSKGFSAFNVLVTINENIVKKYVATAEELSDGVNLSIYNLMNAHGMLNIPQKITNLPLFDLAIHKVFHISFCQRDQPGNNYFALSAMTEDPILILWKWDSDSIKDKVVHKLKLPFHSFKSLQISFSGFRNDQLCLVSNKFFCFYACRPFEMKFCFMIDNPEKSDMKNEFEVVKDYGTKILSHYWICDGNFAFSICTDTHIILFDSYFKIIQAINTVKEINESRSHITTILPMIDCFIAAGTNRRFEIYEKKNDLYELAAEKKIFDFSHNILEKLDKNINDKMSENSDKEKIFHFLSLVSNPISSNDNPYVIATTSLNDIIQINTSYKELDKQLIKHIITPFHSDSIEGMDLCINKPYIITCSLDKYLRVWDYRKKSLILSKNFDEEMYSVAYHPNGMHALVSFPDKILPLHVYYDEIANMTMNAIPLKSNSRTKDIKFSNGGHLFAFDSGSRVEIWDFLNMVPYTLMNNPCKKIFGSNKLNSISWRRDDQFLLISGNENFYEWQLPQKNDYTKRYEMRNFNINCGGYLGNSFTVVCMSDDGYIRKINADSISSYADYNFDQNMKEMAMFNKSKYMVCCTQLNEKTLNYSSGTTCVRLFLDINSKEEFVEVPSHFGETQRVRVSHDENMIFTSGEDGCINIYTIEKFQENEDQDRFFFDKLSSYFTSTCLIKKSKLKEKELERIDLPEKREEKLKKVKADNAEKKDKLKKDLETLKTNLALTKQTEQKIIDQKKNDLHALESSKEQELARLKLEYEKEFTNLSNEYQLELNGKNRELEKIREMIREQKTAYKEEVANLKKEHEEKRTNLEKTYNAQISALESHKKQLEEKIDLIAKKKVLDTNTIDWLNGKVVTVIEKNIDDLKKGIEDLSVHNAHQIKKLKEEMEKLNTNFSNLELERKQMSEEKEKQEKNKDFNAKKKLAAEEEMKQIQKRITEVEEKIIEGKKRNQYLEKCKFVLDYKIKELKKEMGPVEKAIEDLKKITKNYDVELEKFNREHEIISKKLVDFKDLDKKIEELKFEERKEINLIKKFKNTIFKMVNNIDDFDCLKEGFRSLRDIFLKDYQPEKQDMELDAEFLNQKDNMYKNVEDLQKQLKTIKQKHVDSIEHNRKDNHSLIKKITLLQTDIKSEKDSKGQQAADNRHANAIAAIKAQKKIDKIDNMEFDTLNDKMEYLEQMIKKKKKQLSMEKHLNDSDNILNSPNYNDNISEEEI